MTWFAWWVRGFNAGAFHEEIRFSAHGKEYNAANSGSLSIPEAAGILKTGNGAVNIQSTTLSSRFSPSILKCHSMRNSPFREGIMQN